MAHGMAFNFASPTLLLKTTKLPVTCVY